MNTPQVLFVVFVCLELCWSTWSTPLQPTTTAKQWEQETRSFGQPLYSFYLGFCLATASTGKNFFERPESLSEDCVRTASVTMNLLTTPSTYPKTGDWMIPKSFETAIDDKNPITNEAELFCQKLNEAAKIYNVSDFEDLKSKVILPKPEKNYFMQLPQNKSPMQFWQDIGQMKFDDLQLMKLAIMTNFHPSPESQAVIALAEKNAYKSAADALFIRVRDEFAEKALKIQVPFFDQEKFKEFNKEIDEYFEKDSTLKDEYKKLLEEEKKKKEVLEKKSNEKTSTSVEKNS